MSDNPPFSARIDAAIADLDLRGARQTLETIGRLCDHHKASDDISYALGHLHNLERALDDAADRLRQQEDNR